MVSEKYNEFQQLVFVGLNTLGKQVYQGTVSEAVVSKRRAKRRAKNKVARKSRRANRGTK